MYVYQIKSGHGVGKKYAIISVASASIYSLHAHTVTVSHFSERDGNIFLGEWQRNDATTYNILFAPRADITQNVYVYIQI